MGSTVYTRMSILNSKPTSLKKTLLASITVGSLAGSLVACASNDGGSETTTTLGAAAVEETQAGQEAPTPESADTNSSSNGNSSLGSELTANDFPVNVAESQHPAAQPPAEGELRVTLLGTGSPVPSTERLGFSILIQAGDKNYLVDAGRGAIIRLIQSGVEAGELDGIFMTHYHSDHVLSISDLWMTGYVPAFGGREGTLKLYGPEGINNIVDHLRQAFVNDIEVRVADKEVDPETTKIESEEWTEDGVVFEEDGLKVTMFENQHDPAGVIKPSKGYRIDYGNQSVLISGDTIPHENVISHGKDVDLLIHEVIAFEDPSVLPAVTSHHTTVEEANEIFKQTNPRMAAFTHVVNGMPGKDPGISEEELISQARDGYDGDVVLGEDLMSFSITDDAVTVTDQDDLAELYD